MYAKTPLPANLTPANNSDIQAWDSARDFDGVDLQIVRGAVIFNQPLSLGEIVIEQSAASIDLNGKKIKAAECRIDGKRVRSGIYTAASLGLPQVMDASSDASGLLVVGKNETIIVIR